MSVVARLVFNDFGRIARRLPQAANEIVTETVENIESNTKEDMAGPKSGRWYGSHQASAPGESPAIDTRELIESIGHEVRGTEGEVYADAEHAFYMEYGTTTIAPRPFFSTFAEQERPVFMGKMRNLESRLR